MGCQLIRRRRQLGPIGPLHKLSSIADSYATLRDFIEKFNKKKLDKKKFQKNLFRKFSVKLFFQIFFGYRFSAANLGYACKNLKKKFRNFSVNFFFKFFWAISVLQPFWGMRCLQKFGGSWPAGLGGDRDCTDST
jgi:hypothetical protein